MRPIRLPLLACTALMLTACQSSPAPEFVVQEPAVDLHTQAGQVAVIDPKSRVVGTANAIKVITLKTITDSNRLLVEATLRNERGRRDILYYRLRWLDSAGVMLGQYEPWLTESLDGQQQAVITATSPYPHAADFRLEIRSKD
jgi:uncharacterized protein YcfL